MFLGNKSFLDIWRSSQERDGRVEVRDFEDVEQMSTKPVECIWIAWREESLVARQWEEHEGKEKVSRRNKHSFFGNDISLLPN